jgi:hypothetical protein
MPPCARPRLPDRAPSEAVAAAAGSVAWSPGAVSGCCDARRQVNRLGGVATKPASCANPLSPLPGQRKRQQTANEPLRVCSTSTTTIAGDAVSHQVCGPSAAAVGLCVFGVLAGILPAPAIPRPAPRQTVYGVDLQPHRLYRRGMFLTPILVCPTLTLGPTHPDPQRTLYTTPSPFALPTAVALYLSLALFEPPPPPFSWSKQGGNTPVVQPVCGNRIARSSWFGATVLSNVGPTRSKETTAEKNTFETATAPVTEPSTVGTAPS